MVSLATLRSELLEAVKLHVEQRGFRYRKTWRDYVRKFPDRQLALRLAFINHQDDFDVTADVAVRHSSVEDLVNETNTLLSKREKSATFTVGAEFGNIQGIGQQRWTVANDADVPEVAGSIFQHFLDHFLNLVLLVYRNRHGSLLDWSLAFF